MFHQVSRKHVSKFLIVLTKYSARSTLREVSELQLKRKVVHEGREIIVTKAIADSVSVAERYND